MSYKGRYRPSNKKKYRGDVNNIIYRSLWERKFMVKCDHDPDIIEWGSEEVIIPYLSPVDGKQHRYFPDFFVKTSKGEKFLIEFKPKKYTKQPKKPKRVTKRYIYEATEWGKNQAKWRAAESICKRNGWKFLIFTEDHLNTHKYISNK